MKRFLLPLLVCFILSSILASTDDNARFTAHALQETVTCNEAALREALGLGGSIQFAEDCVYQLTRNLPSIQADIVIDGNGAIIDGQNLYRLLSSIAVTGISLHDLTLKNGAYGEGGALYVQQGTVTISNSNFVNNQALFGSGGAIWVKRGSLTITGSSFRENSAYDRGGAIWVGTGDVSVTASTIAANKASAGGGLYAQNSLVTVTSSTFSTNAAQVNTEQSYLYDEGNGGGAIFAENQDVIITNSTFSGNVAITGSNEGLVTVGQGGAVHAATGDIIIVSSTFTQNRAFIGGAVYARDGVIRAEQSLIAENHAEQQGADIPVDGQFESDGYNLIGDDGGGRLGVVASDIVNRNPYLEINEDGLPELAPDSPARDVIPANECATTEDQRSLSRPQGSGCDIGAVEMLDGTENIIATATPTINSSAAATQTIACEETELREAITQGGAISLPADCTIMLTSDLPDVTVSLVLNGNNAVIDGVENYRIFYAPETVDLTLHNLTLQNGREYGIWAARGNVNVDHVMLVKNDGAIYAGSGDVTASDCMIRDNATEEGAAIYAYNGAMVITRCEIEANQSRTTGGAIWAGRGSVTIHDSTFNDNLAQDGSGGAIFVEQGTVEISDSSFGGNLAQRTSSVISGIVIHGGAIAIGIGTLDITDSTFTGNHSAQQGGAIAMSNGVVAVFGTLFEANSANGGGGIYTEHGQITVTNSVFRQNRGGFGYDAEGGGILGDIDANVTVTTSVFWDNTVSGSFSQGGGISTFQGELSVSNSLFYGNSAESGGAIHFWGPATITSSTVVNNTATNDGGGLYAWGSFSLEQSIVAGNSAGAKPDIGAHFNATATSKGYNLIGEPGDLPLARTDIQAEEHGLTFFDNGTYAIGIDSPALDAVPTDHCAVGTDLRGQTRPIGAGCDIGALEEGGADEAPPEQSAVLDVTCDEVSLITALHAGGDIRLAPDCVYTLTRDLPFVTRDLVINGNGATIDGAGEYRILYAPANANITIRDLTFQHGRSDTAGGAIYADSGTVTIDHSMIVHNNAKEYGGGISAGGALTITNSTVAYNDTVKVGGGVAAASSVIITNSTFAHNTAAEGGGLYVNWAGAYDLHPTQGIDLGAEVSINHSTFALNTASGEGGGGILAANVVLSIQNSIVVNNHAKEDADLAIWSNGHFRSQGYNLLGPNPRLRLATTDQIVSDAKLDTFENTYFPLLVTSPALDVIPLEVCVQAQDQRGIVRPQGAGCDVGAVEMEQLAAFVPVPSTPTPLPPSPVDLTCDENRLRQAIITGGTFNLPAGCIIFLARALPTIESNFELQSSASVIDGASQHQIFHTSGLADVTLSGITIRNGIAENGGGIYAEEGDIVLTNCTLENNTATDNGGALYAKSGYVIITNCSIKHNTAAGEYGSGGGVYVGSGDLEVTDSQFVENSALNNSGGGIALGGAYATITNSIFTGNTARDGGGLASRGAGDIVVVSCRFERNMATGWMESDGGGIYADDGLLVVERSVLVENVAENAGGLYTDYGDAVITNSTFYANQAIQESVGSGGALAGRYGLMSLTNCTVVNNSATAWAGGVDMSFGTLEVQQTIITGNKAEMKSDVMLYDGTFTSRGFNLFGCCLSDLPLADTDIIFDSMPEVYDSEAGIVPLSSDSPALDTVPPDDCASQEDQLGTSRPQGLGCDIGAVEMIQ